VCEFFEPLSPAIKERVAKKIKQILDGISSRHLKHGVNYFVEEIGQYVVLYTFRQTKTNMLI